jgi:hypothetical protein
MTETAPCYREPPKTGDKARKVGGSYQALGWIVAAFLTRSGAPRVVFEFETPPGMLHIFNAHQVEKVE